MFKSYRIQIALGSGLLLCFLGISIFSVQANFVTDLFKKLTTDVTNVDEDFFGEVPDLPEASPNPICPNLGNIALRNYQNSAGATVNRILLQWKESTDPDPRMSQYRIRIYNTAGTTILRNLRALSSNGTRGYVGNVATGNYQYDIQALAENPNGSLRVLGTCATKGTFEVKPAPVLATPLCSANLGRIPRTGNNETPLTWGGVPNADKYAVLVSKLEGNVATPLGIIRSTTTTGAVKNLQNGNYKFQVRAEKYDVGGAPCAGGTFSVEEPTGRLTVSVDSPIYPQVIAAGGVANNHGLIISEALNDETAILHIRFNAQDDEVSIKDIYLEDAGPNSHNSNNTIFKLYDATAGRFIQSGIMKEDNSLHFGVGTGITPLLRIPKNGSTSAIITIRPQPSSIAQANETGKTIKLRLADGNPSTENQGEDSGIKATSLSTGNLPLSHIAHGNHVGADPLNPVVGQPFIVYKSKMSVKHDEIQPSFFSGPVLPFQPVYDFIVKADDASNIELGKLTFDIALSGMQFDDGSAPANLHEAAQKDLLVKIEQVKLDGTVDPDDMANVADVVLLDDIVADTKTILASATFRSQKLAKGESRKYRLSIAFTENDGGADTDDDAVSVTIFRDSLFRKTWREKLSDNAELIWSDQSDPAHSDLTEDWLSGYLLEVDTAAKVNNDNNDPSTPQESEPVAQNITLSYNLMDSTVATRATLDQFLNSNSSLNPGDTIRLLFNLQSDNTNGFPKTATVAVETDLQFESVNNASLIDPEGSEDILIGKVLQNSSEYFTIQFIVPTRDSSLPFHINIISAYSAENNHLTSLSSVPATLSIPYTPSAQ